MRCPRPAVNGSGALESRASRSRWGAARLRTGLRIDYRSRDVPGDLPPEVGIVLYRIAQEALRNVLSRSGSKEARVALEGIESALELSVEDSGSGFDPERRPGGAGLGLASMTERARLVGAELAIESRPGSSTRVRIRVRVPRAKKAEGEPTARTWS